MSPKNIQQPTAEARPAVKAQHPMPRILERRSPTRLDGGCFEPEIRNSKSEIRKKSEARNPNQRFGARFRPHDFIISKRCAKLDTLGNRASVCGGFSNAFARTGALASWLACRARKSGGGPHAVQDAGANNCGPRGREASWSATALRRFPTRGKPTQRGGTDFKTSSDWESGRPALQYDKFLQTLDRRLTTGGRRDCC